MHVFRLQNVIKSLLWQKNNAKDKEIKLRAYVFSRLSFWDCQCETANEHTCPIDWPDLKKSILLDSPGGQSERLKSI